MQFLRTNHPELAQRSTKDTSGKGGPSETHFGHGNVNREGWHKGWNLEEVLGALREAWKGRFFPPTCLVFNYRVKRRASILLYCFLSAKIFLEKGIRFSSLSVSFPFIYSPFMKAQEHCVGAWLWSGPAQRGFFSSFTYFSAFFSAACPLCSQTPPLCVTHDP